MGIAAREGLYVFFLYLNASLGETEPLTELFSHERVWVVCLVEKSLQLRELVHREVGSTATLFCLQLIIVGERRRRHALLLLLLLLLLLPRVHHILRTKSKSNHKSFLA